MKQSEFAYSLLEYQVFRQFNISSSLQLIALLSFLLCLPFLGLLNVGEAELHFLVSNS
jgi:hypothetical protein